jgi:tetratricopeptide (TPR) repeat protein
VRRWRVAAFAAGMVLMVVALVSPLDALGSALFSAHMAQHEIMIVLAAPLLVLGRPLVPMLWALPRDWRRWIGAWSRRWVRDAWRIVTLPAVAFTVHALAVLVWHVPAFYQATLTSDLVHALQHISFVGSALLFWRALLGGGARRRARYGAAVLCLFGTALYGSALGALLTVAERPWYPAYGSWPLVWGLTPARRFGELGDREGQEHAAVQSRDLARRHGDRGIEALALIEIGHVATARGDTTAALDAIDRATSMALGEELGPFESGLVYCNAILASRSRGEWDRACEWTESATRWVQRTNVAYFPGLCRVHRSEVLRVRGELHAASHESEQATRWLSSTLPRWECYAQSELGEVRRRLGDLAGAMQAFRRALELGWEPQPGMALLLLAQGDAAAAFGSLERFASNPVPTIVCEDRSTLLAARVTVALAAGQLDAAAAAEAQLAAAARREDALPWDRAAAHRARGELALHRGANGGAATEAVQALTEARLLWAELEAPFELASCRFVLAQALAAAGDRHGAMTEGEVAARTFAGIGSAHDEQQVRAWLERLDRPAPAAPKVAAASAEMRREGDTWQLTFGGRAIRLKDSVGVGYLARLLAAPEENHWAVELAGGGDAETGDVASGVAGDAGEVIDAEARASYRERLRELQEELDDARQRGDEAAEERICSEMDVLARHLASTLGLHGRARRVGGAVERARQSVTKALRSVLRRIGEAHEDLGLYLRATIKTGTACRFEPDPRHPVRWSVELMA